MKKLASSLKKFVFAAFLPFLVTACGDSPGGTGDSSGGTGASSDTTPPVTIMSSDLSRLECSDADSNCARTYYSLNGGSVWNYEAYELGGSENVVAINISGAATAASGAITFFSIDNSNNAEDIQTGVYNVTQ